ncbi:MAG TPA: glycosyltransferase, partial [Bacteroidales bacterium]|nr:glycosyltransferase [Bacteroidales bacterium]
MYKICFITTTSVTLKTFVLETAKYLYKSQLFDITFICSDDENFKEYLPDYINFIPISMKRGFDIQGIFSVFKLYKVFKNSNFDLVQYSTPNASFYAGLSAKLAKVPIRLYCQWGIRYVGFKGARRWLFKTIEKLICQCSTDIRAVSKMNMRFSIEENLYSAEKVKILGEGGTIGVDLKVYDINLKNEYRSEIRQKYSIKDEFVFGFVGRLSKDKGTNELLASFKNIASTSNVKLFVIGDMEADKSVSHDLLLWAKKSKQVIFTGHISQNELVKFYAAFDCYVHPTYREGFGMVLQEAAAMGNAIITTNIPGASEVMEENIS